MAVLLFFDATQGVEPQSETVWRQADRFNVPRICFVNKMDRVGASYEWTIDTIRQRLGANPIQMQIPIGFEADFCGVVDLLTMQALFWEDELGKDIRITDIPADLKEEAESKRSILIEKIAELDDDLIVKYLEDEVISIEEIKAALRRAVIKNLVTPVFCGTALRNKGVQIVLDAVLDYLPSPLDVPPVKGINPQKDTELELLPDDEAPMSALVFKIVTDPYVGRLAYIRVYSGVVTQGVMVYNPIKGKKERIGRLLHMYADRREDVTEVYAGDIGAVIGLKNSFTGDTLCSQHDQVVLENISFPEPVISVAIEPKTLADQDKMVDALRKLSEEDPTFRMHMDESTGQTIISGMGELHLDVLIDRMLREFRVKANIGRVRVTYRETITRPVKKVSYRYVKQTGGHGQYGHVVFDLEPIPGGTEILFEDKIQGGVIPREYIRSIENGVREAAESGVLAGYQTTGIKVTLVDGSFHEVDSNDVAFRMAAILGFKQAVEQGAPILLEPIMKVEALSPEEYLGEILSSLNSRRAEILGMENRPGNTQAVRAQVPLGEMFGYATSLRSATQGRGIFTMEFDHYAPVSDEVAAKIL